MADAKKKARGLRIGAIILWILAVGFEIATIYLLNNVQPNTFAYIALGLDAVACIIGSLLWKRSNRYAPCESKNKTVKFIWDQMGLIACLIAFLPFGLFLLKDKNIDPKTKKIFAVMAAVLFAGTVGTSIDYDPVSPGDIQHQEAIVELEHGDIDEVFFTQWGRSYHIDEACFHIADSPTKTSGSLEEAFEQKKTDPCDNCVGDLWSGNDTTEDDPIDDVTDDDQKSDAETSEVEEAETEGEETETEIAEAA